MKERPNIKNLIMSGDEFVVVTQSENEAEMLDTIIRSITGTWVDCREKFISRKDIFPYNGEVAFHILNGRIKSFRYKSWFEDGYSIPTYNFKDLVSTANRNGVPLVALHSILVDTNESDIDKAIRLSKEVREQLEKNNKKLKEKKEMRNTFFTEQGERIDTTCNKKIKTITTYAIASLVDNESAFTTCDKSEYNSYTGALVAAAKIIAKKSEETRLMYDIAMKMWGTDICNAILETFANRAFAGNFKKYYNKWLKDEKRYNDNKCKCNVCGEKFNTPDEARKHEVWHTEHKRQKYENYLIQSEAKRRLALEERERKIEAMMDKLDNDDE